MFRLRRLGLTASLALVIGIGPAGSIDAATSKSLQAVPFTFVGTAPGCEPTAPGSRIASAGVAGRQGASGQRHQQRGAGSPHRSARRTPPVQERSDARLLLSRSGDPWAEEGRDPHGARLQLPQRWSLRKRRTRFNVTDDTGHTFFFGCFLGTKSPAPQDAQWTRVRFTTATAGTEGFIFGPNGTKVTKISIVFDEGADTASADDPTGVGLAVLDNIEINYTLITRGPSGHKTVDHDDSDRNDKHDGHDATTKSHRMD